METPGRSRMVEAFRKVLTTRVELILTFNVKELVADIQKNYAD